MSSNPLIHLAADGESPPDIAAQIRDFQLGLKQYITGLLGGMDGVDDLVQETNIFLWERRDEYGEDSNFRAWAMRVAWFKVMAARRDRAREGRVVFSEALLEQIAARAEERLPEVDERLAALRFCLGKTRPQDRRILEWKYVRGGSLTALAETMGCSQNSIHKNISRLRLALRHCVEKQLEKYSR